MKEIKLDILAIGAHRDDCEIMAGGTIIKMVDKGYKVGILDLTQGEMGTRGSADIRAKEAYCAQCRMGVIHRENLELPDTRVEVNYENRLKLIQVIRRLKPDIVLAPHWEQRHPDHRNTSWLVQESAFYSGLKKYPVEGAVHRPKKLIYYLPFNYEIKPDFFVDISDYFQKKIEIVKCYYSQFVDIQKDLHLTPYVEGVLEKVEYFDGFLGRAVNVKYAEGFVYQKPLLIDDFSELRVNTF